MEKKIETNIKKLVNNTNNAKLTVRILALLLAAVISFFFVNTWVSESTIIQDTLESVKKSEQTVMALSAATLSASLAISAFPDDFATPLADSLADMNVYFIAVLVVLLLEKILVVYGVKLTFTLLIPCACIAGVITVISKKQLLRSFSVHLVTLGLAVAFVVPFSTHITQYVASDLTDYVEATIAETEDGAEKLNTAMEDSEEGKTVFEKLSDLFQTAIRDVSDLMSYFKNNIRRCMNSIAILILTNIVMPVITFGVLKWVLKETFNIVIPVHALRRRRRADEAEFVTAGGITHEA